MAPKDFAPLAEHLEPVTWRRGTGLFERDTKLEHVFFLDEGLGSLLAVSPEGHRVEVGIFGREGFAPVSLALGVDRMPYDALIQMAGNGWRIAAAPFQAALAQSTPLRDLLLRFIETLSVQASFTALSNAIHPIDERLARWLLMSHDRSDGKQLGLTHEFLSLMLGVRRPSVTSALHTLEGNGFIRSERGCITIRDRPALEAFAADAYGKPEEVYRRLIGPLD